MVQFVFIFVLVFGLYVSAMASAETCGKLHPTYTYSGSSTNCDIRLTPSPDMLRYIKNNFYRWNQYTLRNQIVVIDKAKTNITTNPQKFSESNFTLHIKGLESEDEGTFYMVECKRDARENYIIRSTQVEILFPKTSTSATTSWTNIGDSGYSTDDTSKDGTTSLTVIVVALCVVVVVVLVTMTIIIVSRRKQAVRDGNTHQQLVTKDESSVGDTVLREAGDESVYNEIDNDVVQETSDTKNVRERASSHQHLVSLDASPRLPSRPNDYTIAENEEYAMANGVKYANIISKESALSKEMPSSQTNKTTIAGDAADEKSDKLRINKKVEYAKVLPKSLRQHTATQGKVTLNDKTDKEAQHNIAIKENKNTFTVLFPKINCEDVTASLGETSTDITGRTARAEYTNIARRSKRQRSKRRNNELLYIEIDHSGSELDLHDGLISRLAAAKLDTEYTSIDFDKKAFVAPIRKAPSSWYKRRKKKKDK